MMQEKWKEEEIKRRLMLYAAGQLAKRGLLDSAEKSRMEQMIIGGKGEEYGTGRDL